ncbi:MAG: hypothetical protein WC979_03290 [Candidatus Pacearchaeota archaeon]|jgi:hypothetical protein|nr:hypothetical protein [Clostridia bacterium]
MKKLQSNISDLIGPEYGTIDLQCVEIIEAMNSLPGVMTIESCCGHDKTPFRIWFYANVTNEGLFFLTRCADRRYWQYGDDWRIELSVGDTYRDDILPTTFCLTSITVKGDEAHLQIKDLVDNMNYHLNHKNFMDGFDLDYKNFKYVEI